MSQIHLFPKHLQKIVIPAPEPSDTDAMLHGELCCTCGGRRFAVRNAEKNGWFLTTQSTVTMP